jgi:uncharacterized protein YgiM (DUF1202 family)
MSSHTKDGADVGVLHLVERSLKGGLNMRKLYSAIAMPIAALAISAAATAATFPVLPIIKGDGFQTVADMEMTVANEYANLREKPTTSSKLVTKLTKGTKVTVIEKVAGGKWAHVKVNNMEGYVATRLLK